MRICFIILFCFVSLITKAQNSQPDIDSIAIQNLQHQLDTLTDAFIKQDFKTMMRYTYPGLIAKAGGKDKLLAQITQEMNNIAREGIFFDSMRTGSPAMFVNAGKEIHTLIPQTLFLKTPRGILKSESHLIGITSNQGQTWYFLDAANADKENIKEILPNYNFHLVLPPYKKPVIIRPN